MEQAEEKKERTSYARLKRAPRKTDEEVSIHKSGKLVTSSYSSVLLKGL